MLTDQRPWAGSCEHCGRRLARELGGATVACDCAASRGAAVLDDAREYFERKGVGAYFAWLRDNGHAVVERFTDDNFWELKRRNARLWRRRVDDLARDAVATGFIK